jgi:hypothetical protein
MLRAGQRGAAAVLGLYGWDGTGTPALIGDTYDGRNGKTGNYIPSNYTRHAPLALSYFASNGRLVIYHPQKLVDAGSESGTNFRWLWTRAPSDTGPALTTCPTNAGIQAQWIVAVYCTATTYYAITAGPPARVWTSTDGLLWTQGAALSGTLPTIQDGTPLKVVEFLSGRYAFGGAGLYSMTADLATWTAIPLLSSGTYSSVAYKAIAADATALMILAEGIQISDGERHNLLLRSTDGTTFTAVRDVEQDADQIAPIAQGARWDFLVAFGTGFLVYGIDALTNFFPKVLASTDHGATWSSGANLSHWSYNSVAVTGYPGANRVVASIPLDLTSGPYEVLHKSTDGVTFTPLTF